MNRLVVLLILFLSQCFATGWNDYEINLKNGYSIFRSNSQDIQLAKTNGEHLIYSKLPFRVGNLMKYFIVDDYIFTINKKMAIEENLSFNSLQKSNKVFCIINVKSSKIEIFEERNKFDAKIKYISDKKIKWVTIEDKRTDSILGLILTTIFQFFILSIKYYWLTVGIFIIFGYLYFIPKTRS